MTPARDPRKNAPACISHLHGDARTAALAARHEGRRRAYMRMYEQPAKVGLLGRVLAMVRV